MKKLNIIVLLSTIIMFCLLFVAACSSETIAAPRNLEIIEGTSVSWDKVDGAVRYTVNIDGKEYYTADTSYPLSQLTVPAVYQIKIKASSAIGNVSLFSDTVKHYVGTPGLIYLDRYASIGVSELGTADTSETVIIAAFWQGRQVEWIWSEAFYNCISLKSIII